MKLTRALKKYFKTRHSVRPEVVETVKKKECSIQQTSKTSRSLSSSISAIFQRVVRVLFVCRFPCIGPCKGGPRALERRISPLHTRIAASRHWDSYIILSLLRRSSCKKLAETLTDEPTTWADRQRSERECWL